MGVTNKGKGWEARNSLWLIWTFVMLFNWIAFFWIGGRAKQRKWILFGCLYLVLCFVVPFFAVEVFKDNEIMENIFFGAFFIAWIASIIHAFLSRKEYLIRREAIVANQAAAVAAYRQQVQAGYVQQGNFQQPIYQSPTRPYAYPMQQNQQVPQQAVSEYPAQPIHSPPGSQPNPQKNIPLPPSQQQLPGQQTSQPIQKIDLNTATEQQLSSLPGVGVAFAKRAVDMRTQNGGFTSVQDFNQRLGLMPHFAVQIENMAFVSPTKLQTPPTESSGRIIDI